MGKNPESLDVVQLVIDNCNNIVIDADAISKYNFQNKNIVITPHKGELLRLEIEYSRESLMSFSSENNLTILLKGESDIITDGFFFKNNIPFGSLFIVEGSQI